MASPKPAPLKLPSQLTRPIGRRSFWPLDPHVTFLNHGSFGCCPHPVLKHHQQLVARMERQPIRFLVDELEGLLDAARRELARFVNAPLQDLVFVQNASSGVNTVLRSLAFKPGDEVLVTDHAYNACRNALEFVARCSGIRVVVVKIPFPVATSQQVVDAVLAGVSRRTRLAMLDHVTSATGLILPVREMVAELAARKVDSLVDGAHAPGMLPLNLRRLGAAYYTGNCHKWLCSPKGTAFLYVRPDRQASVHPLTISHGYNAARSDRSRFLLEFGWMGTGDVTAFLSVPAAIRAMGGLLPGGWPHLMQRNRALALAARNLLCDSLGVEAPCPEKMVGALATVPLPDVKTRAEGRVSNGLYALRGRILREHGIEVPVFPWPAPPRCWLRVSAQAYNSLPDYVKLAEALKRVL